MRHVYIMLFIVVIVVFHTITNLHASLCPLVFTQKDFNITKYAGLWYEAYRHDINEVESKCENGTYTPSTNGTMNVLSQGFSQMSSSYYSNEGLAKPKKESEPAAFLIHYKNPTKTVKYNIIQTDYDQYSLIYSCDYFPIVDIKFEHIWFLSRNKTLPETVVEELKKVLKHMHAKSDDIKPTAQDC